MHQVYIANYLPSVRTITADFGFSFALPVPPPTIQPALPTEPPTKRRKTKDSISPKRQNHVEVGEWKKAAVRAAKSVETLATELTAVQSEIHPERTNNEDRNIVDIATLPAQEASKPSKKSSQPRRKLDLDEEIEQRAQRDDGEAQSGGLEDTFIFGLKPKKRQTKCKAEEELITDTSKQTSKKIPIKERKTTKATPYVEEVALDDPITKDSAEPVMPEEKSTESPVADISKQPLKKSSARGRKPNDAKQQAEYQPAPDHTTEPSAEPAISGKKSEELALPETSQQASKKVPSKGRKPTKAQQQTQQELVLDAATGLPAQPVVFEERPKASRRKPAAKKHAEIIPADSHTSSKAPTTEVPSLEFGGLAGTLPLAKLLVDETALLRNPERLSQ